MTPSSISYTPPEFLTELECGVCGGPHKGDCFAAQRARFICDGGDEKLWLDDDTAQKNPNRKERKQRHGDVLHVLGYYAVRIGLIVILVTIFCLWLTS